MINMENNISGYSFENEYFMGFHETIYVIDVILLISNIIGLASNGIILYVFYKTKSWKTTIYALIANWAVMDILHLLTSHGLLKWYQKIYDIYQDFGYKTYANCLNLAFELGIILIAFLLIYIDIIKFFKMYYLKILAFVWLVIGVLCICAFVGIEEPLLQLSMFVSMILYVIFMTIVIVTCIAFIVKKRYIDKDVKLILVMVTVYICFWLSFILAAVLVTIFGEHFVLSREIVFSVFALGEMDALANLYFLTKWNGILSVYFHRIFNCHKNKRDDEAVYECQPKENVQIN